MQASSVVVTDHALSRWLSRVGPGGKPDVTAALLRSRPATRRQCRRPYGADVLARYDDQTGAVLIVRHELDRWVVKTVLATEPANQEIGGEGGHA
jgi:hypothetical protein